MQAELADFDGDGRLDFIVTQYFSSDVSVFRNTSAGPGDVSFSYIGSFASGGSGIDLAVDDLDGDGIPDVAVANSAPGTVSLLKNISSGPGNIAFGSPVVIGPVTNSTSIRIGDLNLDGKPDLLAVSLDGNVASVFINNGAPPPPQITSFAPASGPVGTSVTITGANSIRHPLIILCTSVQRAPL